MSKTRLIELVAVVGIFLAPLGYFAGHNQKDADKIEELATKYEQAIYSDERMIRGRTNFERPGVTQETVTMIVTVSGDYGMPPEMLYAMIRTENGGRGLYYGAHKIDLDIRKRYPPIWWQPAMVAKTWNKHLNSLVMKSPEMLRMNLRRFAQQWNEKPDEWADNTMLHLDNARGPKGLEVTEPPKPGPKKAAPEKVGGKIASEANGGGHKPSKHSHKEKKR